MDALRESIEHWKENLRLNLDTYSNMDSECALCRTHRFPLCEGCPVEEETGQIGCMGSPWSACPDEDDLEMAIEDNDTDTLKHMQVCVLHELNFLEKLAGDKLTTLEDFDDLV